MAISKRVRDNLPLLKKLKSTRDPKERKKILESADKKLIGALIEVVANVLNRKVILKPEQVKKLSKHKKDFIKLGKTRSLTKGKEIIVQNGGSFLPLLLGAVIPLITSLITKN